MKYKNKAHQSVYEKGRKAALSGEPRAPMYGSGSNTERYFRNAWLKGYDRGALELAADVMRRSDPEALTTGDAQASDAEWNRSLDVTRQALAAAA